MEVLLRLLFLLFVICIIIIGIILVKKVKSHTRKICCLIVVLFAVSTLLITLYSGRIKNKYTLNKVTLTQAVDMLIENIPKNEEIDFQTENFNGCIEVKETVNGKTDAEISFGKRKGKNDNVVQLNDSIFYTADDYVLTREYFLGLSTEGYGVTKISCDQYDIWITFSFKHNPKLEFMYWTIGSPLCLQKRKH